VSRAERHGGAKRWRREIKSADHARHAGRQPESLGSAPLNVTRCHGALRRFRVNAATTEPAVGARIRAPENAKAPPEQGFR